MVTQMPDDNNQSHQIDDARLKGAVLHPRRLEILNLLSRKPDGTRELELVKALGLPLPQVEYHLKVLEDADLIANLEGGGKRGKAGRSYVTAAAVR